MTMYRSSVGYRSSTPYEGEQVVYIYAADFGYGSSETTEPALYPATDLYPSTDLFASGGPHATGGGETETLTAQISSTDTGAGSDSTHTLAVARSDADAGAGTDAA